MNNIGTGNLWITKRRIHKWYSKLDERNTNMNYTGRAAYEKLQDVFNQSRKFVLSYGAETYNTFKKGCFKPW